MLRALRHRNYRLFFGGQSVSLVGTWMTRLATSWLIYRLTRSALLLGLVSFAGQIPTFLLAPFAGVWVDRWDRHRVLLVTQILAMIQSLALFAMAFSGHIGVWSVLWLSAFQGLINAFDMPARQAFVVQMVDDRRDLGNAVALNSSMVNMARLVGPSIAGIVIAGVGEAYCFLIDGVSYLAVIASLLLMNFTAQQSSRRAQDMLKELKQGWDYVFRFAPIRSILLLLALVSLMGMPYTVLMPIIAGDILHGGPHTLGFLMAATGVGAVSAAFRLAARRSVLGLGKLTAVSAGIFGAGLVAFSQSHYLWLSLILLYFVGLGMMQQMASSNTILQTIVEDDKRGRVMSYYAMAFTGMAPFGSLLAGALAHRIGAPGTLLVSGLSCIAGAIWFATRLPLIRQMVRPIYAELGILPQVAAGMQQATTQEEARA